MAQSSFDFVDNTVVQCNKCKETKDVNEFYKTAAAATGRFSVCKPCYIEREVLKKRLKAGFSSLMTDHCECCKKTDVKLQLDHCHDSGMFRGFICRSCNQTLGWAGDTLESVRASDKLSGIYVDYLSTANYRMGKKLT